jgi:hypothetical protein
MHTRHLATDRKALFLKETAHKAPSHRETERLCHMNAISDVIGWSFSVCTKLKVCLVGKQSNVVDTTQIMCVSQFYHSSGLLSLTCPVH